MFVCRCGKHVSRLCFGMWDQHARHCAQLFFCMMKEVRLRIRSFNLRIITKFKEWSLLVTLMFEFVVMSISDKQLSSIPITRMTSSTKLHSSSKPSRNDCDVGRCGFVESSDHAHDLYQTQSVLSKCGHAPYTLSHESHKRST
jgi:hypothetical protein